MHFVHPDRLSKFSEQYKEQYQLAEPFPHVVIDNFLPADALREVEASFPRLDAPLDWRVGDEYQRQKRGFSKIEFLSDPIQRLLLELNSYITLEFLEDLTGISQLTCDPFYIGGGIHQVGTGGFLKIHHDFTMHPKLKIERKINLLIYLNSDWDESYGGALELWDSTMSKCVVKLQPIFNRCVIFNTNKISFHGHPDPMTCPPGKARKSVALYYYSTQPFAKAYDDHLSVWHERPNETLNAQTINPVVEEQSVSNVEEQSVSEDDQPIKEAYFSFKKQLVPFKQIPWVNTLNDYRKQCLKSWFPSKFKDY